jgi:hypothetical protein
MKITRFALPILFSAMLVWTAGCGIFFPFPDWHPFTTHSDPLKGWTFREFDDFLPSLQRHNYHLDKAITDDYQDFIKKNGLDPDGAITGFYEDGTGQHAVEFAAFPPDQNATWNYVLIYDKENKRIKVIKWNHIRYQS